MKKNLSFFIVCLSATITIKATAQNLSCTTQIPAYAAYQDPEPPTRNLWCTNYPTLQLSSTGNSIPATGYLNGDQHFYYTNACTGNTYTYTLNFTNENTYVAYGFLFYISGGSVTNAVFTKASGSSTNYSVQNGGNINYPVTSGNLDALLPDGGTVSPFTKAVFTIVWQTASASNSFQFFGYNNDFTLSTFLAVTANASAYPATPTILPTNITTSSPVTGGWLVVPVNGSTLSNAGYFNWTNNGVNLGAVMGIYPNAQHPYWLGPAIPNTNTYAINASMCVTPYTASNSCAASTPVPNSTICKTVSIPGVSSCSYCRVAPNAGEDSINSTAIVSKNTIFPNPSHGTINVLFNNMARHKVEVISLQGKIVKTINTIQTDKIQVDLGKLARGTYYVLTYENNVITGREKVIIQ